MMNEAHAAEASRRGFEIIGELGHTAAGQMVYLAREKAGTALIAIRVEYTSPGTFTFSILRKLDTSVPAAGVSCPYCRASLPGWGRFCGQCGANITTVRKRMRVSGDAVEMLNAVRSASAGEYEVLGQMIWEDGRGAVYFAREIKTGRLTALRLQRQEKTGPESEEYALGQTRVLTPLARSLGAAGKKNSPKPPRVVMAPPQPPFVDLGDPTPVDSSGSRLRMPARYGDRSVLFLLTSIALLLAALLTAVLIR